MAISYRNSFENSTNVRFYMDNKQVFLNKLLSILWFFSKPLAKYIIKKMFFASRRFTVSPDQKRILKNAERFFIISGNKRIKCWKLGTGPSIVFVHGWSGRGIQFDSFFDSFIEAGYSILFLDTPGHGESEGKTSSYFEFSDSITDLVKREDIDVAAFVAHSLGGSAVINHLSRIKMDVKTILIAPALDLITTLDKTFEQYGVPAFIFNCLLKELEKQTGHFFKDENPIDLIGKIESELFIVHDRNDKATSFYDSKKASQTYDNVVLHETKNLGHLRILKDSAIRDLIVDYVKPKMLY